MKKNLILLLVVTVIAAFSLTGCKSLFGPEEPWIPKSWAPLTGYSRLARAASFSGLIQAVIQAAVDNRVTVYPSWEGYMTKTMTPDATQEGYFTYQAEQKVKAPQSGLTEYRMRVVDHLFGPEDVTYGVTVDGNLLTRVLHEAGGYYLLFWVNSQGEIITTPQGN